MKRLLFILLLIAGSLSEGWGQVDTRIYNYSEVVRKYEKTGNVIHALLPDFKDVWKQGVTQFISIPESGGLKTYVQLEKLLSGKGNSCTPKNTILICTENNVKYVKEVASRMPVYVNSTNDFYAGGGKMVKGTVAVDRDKKEKNAFVFVLEKEL